MSWQIGQEGNVYYSCPKCGREMVVMPNAELICTDRRCRHAFRFYSVSSFVRNYNEMLYVTTELPKMLEKSVSQVIGKPIANTRNLLQATVESNLATLKEQGYIDQYMFEFKDDGTIGCDFVIPAMYPRVMRIDVNTSISE